MEAPSFFIAFRFWSRHESVKKFFSFSYFYYIINIVDGNTLTYRTNPIIIIKRGI